ncbi:hypothetical protein F4677DRAFT_449810 [Hypoxylon crocopeplum]|nr:hypothetical protein F4677DRAFT_449810 [Hypoxylon crocopeplum]
MKTEETTKWLGNSLEKKSNEGGRVLSPETEKRIRQLMIAYEKSDFGHIKEKRAEVADSTLEMMKDELVKRLTGDERYADAKKRLDALTHDMFFLKYGDYFAQTCGFLRSKLLQESKAARKQPIDTTLPPGPPLGSEEEISSFKAKPWAAIFYGLSEEKRAFFNWHLEGESKPRPAAPMTDLLRNLTNENGPVNYRQGWDSIMFYAKRSSVAHTHIGAMMTEHSTATVSYRVQEDLRDLAHVTSVNKEFKADRKLGNIYLAVLWPEDKMGRFVRSPEGPTVGYVEANEDAAEDAAEDVVEDEAAEDEAAEEGEDEDPQLSIGPPASPKHHQHNTGPTKRPNHSPRPGRLQVSRKRDGQTPPIQDYNHASGCQRADLSRGLAH